MAHTSLIALSDPSLPTPVDANTSPLGIPEKPCRTYFFIGLSTLGFLTLLIFGVTVGAVGAMIFIALTDKKPIGKRLVTRFSFLLAAMVLVYSVAPVVLVLVNAATLWFLARRYPCVDGSNDLTSDKGTLTEQDSNRNATSSVSHS